MLERFTYTNSFNETLEFGKDCLFVNENDLRDFAWNITSKNDRISHFKKGIVSKTIPVILKCATESEGANLRNRIFEVFEKDVLTRQHGRLQIGDYYLRCYITGSKKTQYLIDKSYMVVTLTVQTDLPEWVKETTSTHVFTEKTEDYLDYPYDFSFDFKNPMVSTSIINESIVSCDFIMHIYGGVTNPTLYIGQHKYAVNVSIDTNDHLTIDSVNKTIILTTASGTQVNCFHLRDRDSYVFEKIPHGVSVVTASNSNIKFDLTLLEERSEPKWT